MKIELPSVKNVGSLEILLASYPILVAYQYGFLRFDVLILLIMSAISFAKRKIILKNKRLTLIFLYVILHEFIWLFVTGGSQTQINNIISLVVIIGSVFIIVPAIDAVKLKNSFYLIGLIVMAGLLYHVLVLARGGSITPIQIPFLPDMGADSRFHEIYDNRPTSFFEEPAGAAVYLLVPFWFSLRDAKYLWSAVIGLFVLLSTSTNGIVFLAILSITYVGTQKLRWWNVVLIMIVGIGLGYIYLTNSAFEVGREKIEGTEYEQTSRLFNGPEIVTHMPSEDLIMGMPYHTIEDYYKSNSLKDAILLESHKGFYFVSAIWYIIIKYGIVGFLIFGFFYLWLFQRGKQIWPYLIVVLIGMVSSSTILNGGWAYQTIILLSLANTWSPLQRRTLRNNFK